ncbi:hypothetical protein FACS189490_09920 [Clostridia bacterium]|nr:hypothetical protein FACS189490_09920 [Clostridia bacterium]
MLKICVLVSGNGTNLQSIIDNVKSGYIKAEIACVVSDKENAYAVERARMAGIEAICLLKKDYENLDKGVYEDALFALCEQRGVGLVLLAGFNTILSADFVKKYENRIMNVHPSLIPAFCGKGYYGLKPHTEALKKGVRVTGATVHFVTEETDGGPIILQKAVNVERGDTPETLQKRVMLEAEHIIYPEAVKLFAENRLSISDGIVHIKEAKINVLLIGSGGREHAIAWKLAQSDKVEKILCAPGNAGTHFENKCENVDIAADDVEKLLAFAKENEIGFTVVGPEDALAAGIADSFNEAGLRIFAPTKNAARLETSKAFSKDLMKKYGIPTASYENFTDFESAVAFIKNSPDQKFAVKTDGLAAGKGAVICESKDEAIKAAREMLQDKVFGSSGEKIVIESFLEGKEVSVLALCDGKTLVTLPPARDHKRALDGDKGLNTGGMGTVSPVSGYDAETAKRCREEIFLPTVAALKSEGIDYRGVIFFGIMLTKDGPKLLEYNARFGDPETQAVLPLIDNDLLDLLIACADGKLDTVNVSLSGKASACVIAVSGGYPEKHEKGFPIRGLKQAEETGAKVFHAGTKLYESGAVTNGGRILGVSCQAETLDLAIRAAYESIGKISFKDMAYRIDIGLTQ